MNTRTPTTLPHTTLDKLQALRLHGMLKALAEQLSSRLRQARLKHNASLEDLNYRAPRGLEQGLILQLSSGQWLRDGLNLIINGPTGVGKTWQACSLVHHACRDGYSVRYLRLPRLLEELALAHGDGRLRLTMQNLRCCAPTAYTNSRGTGVRISVG